MKPTRPSSRRRLLLEHLPTSDDAVSIRNFSARTIESIKDDGVGTVFIISSEAVDADSYLALVRGYESEGLRVRNIHIERLDDRAIPGVMMIVNEIRERFRRESCLVVSYGRSLAPLIVTCYHVSTGLSPTRAINRLRRIDRTFPGEADEIAFIYAFKKCLLGDRIDGEDGDI